MDDDQNEMLAEATREVKALGDGITEMRQNLERRMDDIERKSNRSRLYGGGDYSIAHSADREAEHKALGNFVKTGNDIELKAMSVGSDPDGGYFVLPQMSTTMIRRIFDQSPIRRIARVQPITTGDGWEEPIDKSDPDATWVGEQETRPATATPPVGMLFVPLNEIEANQSITQKLLDTSFVDIGAWVEMKLADKFGRTEGLSFVSGDGIKKPRGFLTYDTAADGDFTRAANALQYVPTGIDAAVTADSLRDLYWHLRAAHRAKASWLMASATANVIDKLKDGEGSYLWRQATTADTPPTLLGRPVEFDENMPAVGSGTFPVAFGDWQEGYLIVDRPGLKMLRDPFTNKPNVQFYCFRRVGGSVANTDAIKLLKASAA